MAVLEKTVTVEGIGFTLQNDREILVHVPSGRQEFSITPTIWKNALAQLGMTPEQYFGS